VIPRRGADGSLGIQQPANAEEAGGSRIQAEDAEGPFQAATATIGMPQDADERLSGLDRRRVAERDREIIAGVFPELIDQPIRHPDRWIEEVQDGGEALEPDDEEVATPDMGQLVEQDPSELLIGQRSVDSTRHHDGWPDDPPDPGRGDRIVFRDPDGPRNPGEPTQLPQVDAQPRIVERGHPPASRSASRRRSRRLREPSHSATPRRPS